MANETIVLANCTVTVDNSAVGKVESVEISPEILMEEVLLLGSAYPVFNLVKGRRITVKLSKVHVSDTFWDMFSYSSYPSYSKSLSTTTIVFANTISSLAKTHTFTITGPQIMKFNIKGDTKGYYIEDIEIVGTGCTYATA